MESLEKSLFETATSSGTLTKDLCDSFETTLKSTCERSIITKDDTSIYRDALSMKSLSSCDAISDETTRLQCRDTILFQEAVTTSDITLCAKISGSTRAAAFRANLEARADALSFQKLVTTGTLSDCKTLRSEKYQNQCHDMVIIRMVTKDRDTTLCDTLYATGMIDRCQKMSGR